MKKVVSSLLCVSVLLGGSFVLPNALAYETTSSVSNPTANFEPDRCVRIGKVERYNKGYNIWTPGGGTHYYLPDAGNEGTKTPVKEKEVEIMLSSSGNIVGWRVL